MELRQQNIAYPFLQGGGEMGKLTRQFNWAETAIGDPSQWPHSLRTTVSNMLRSKFPMFLWWGKDMIQFYNDAYRPSLGNEGKHPSALGAKGPDTWPEIWDIISPLQRQVETTGEATWMEDQLVPIYRNGKIEDAYWTHSYSSVLDDDGNHAGILVTCTETTKTVNSFRQVKENEARFQNLVRDASTAIVVLTGEEMKVEIVNEAYGRLVGLTTDEMLNKPLFEVISDARDYYLPLLEKVRRTGEPVVLDESLYSVVAKGNKKDGFLHVVYQPYRDAAGTIVGVMAILQDITAQVQARKKLQESEARLELLSNTVPAMIFYLDREQRYQSYNETFMRWFGVNETEAIGKAVREFIGEKAYEKAAPHLLKAYAGEQVLYEMRAPSRIGEERWLNIVYTPHKSTDGQVLGVIVLATDVTQSKQAEIALRESETRFRSLIEEAPIATCLFVGRELVIDVANPRMIELWGKSPAILGTPLAEALPELKGQSFLQILDDVFTTGKTYEARGARAQLEVNGELSTYYFDFTYKPLRNAEGNVYAILEMAEDVTEQVLAKEALEKSEANLRNVILQSPIAMAILRGPSFVVELANDRMFELWGRERAQLVNRSIFEGLPEVKDQGYEELLKSVFNTGKTFSALGIPVNLPRNGKTETVYINLLYEAFREGDGTISGIMAVAMDVTEQVLARQKIEELVGERTKELAAANEALLQTNGELQRSNQNLEEFAHAASHDLKEPVRKIHFFTEKLKSQLGPHANETAEHSFNRIENATQRMINLIDDLLLYSHVSQRPIETETLDLNQKVQRVLDDLELDVQEKRAVIHVGKLPVIQGYRRQIQQLFQNLISNALKYSKKDVAPEISISASEVTENGKRYDLIEVKDNGIGFEQHYADKIFQMFSRLHGKHEYSGTGVGLSIVKKVVENHNGFIRAESSPGEGARFRVYLPV